MNLLCNNFNPSTLPELMCTEQVSVGYDGKLFDCDFNQMLEVSVNGSTGTTVWEIQSLEDLEVGVAHRRKDPVAAVLWCSPLLLRAFGERAVSCGSKRPKYRHRPTRFLIERYFRLWFELH